MPRNGVSVRWLQDRPATPALAIRSTLAYNLRLAP
jgi:hypothetical protein